MKLVIEIPEEYRSNFEDNRCKEKFDSLASNEFGYVLRKAFENGKPLPKRHGRLIDADALCDYFWDNRSKLYTHKDLRIVIDNAPTIIEADKKYEVEIITRGNCMMCGKELDEGLFFCKECEERAESGDK